MENEVIKLFEPEIDWLFYFSGDTPLKTMKRCKNVTLEPFQRSLIKIGENYKVVDPATRIEEWSDAYGKSKGTKKAGKKHGIVREVGSSYIKLSQFKDDQLHGLDITWYSDGDIIVQLYKNDNLLASIRWHTKDWTEKYSLRKSVFDGVVSINDFRP